MDMEKGIGALPKDIEEELEDMGGVELDLDTDALELAEDAMNEDGSMDIIIGTEIEILDMGEFDMNLAEVLDDSHLQELSNDLVSLVDADIGGRREWADAYVKGLDVLGFKLEERTDPWEGACGVYSTVLAEAAIRFQAETMSEVFPAAGPVKTKILGEETKEKIEASERVRADMNYELTENMTEYRPEHERLLYSLGLGGSGFKKVYFDPNLGRQTASYTPAEDVIVPYGASTIETAERVTHIMRKTKNEVKKLQAKGFYKDIELDDPVPYHSDIEERKAEEGGFTLTDDDRHALYEIHVDYVIEGLPEAKDEIARPYVVTIDKSSGDVLGIRRNWEEEDDLYKKRQHFVHYVYVPGFGFYGLGLIHIIGGYAKAGTSLIRQLVDAGTLANLPGGLKSRGLRIKGDDTPIEPGEFKDVDVPSGSIRDNIMPLPYKEPSQTLLSLLQQITTEGRRLGAIADMNVSDMSANAPVGTTLALLERTLKPMAAVMARVHFAMKQEFKLLKAIMAEEADEEYSYQPHRGEVSARQLDYAMVDVIPVSDPNSSTMAQRVVQYQAVLQMSEKAPQIYDLPILHRQMIEVMGIKNSDKIVPTREDGKPIDPVSENMNALVGKPIMAFIHQDHKAHIAAHTSFMQDPQIAQMIGQNPQAQQIMAALQAHIAEHLGFQYREQIEEKLGVSLPPPGEELPNEIEADLSRLIAEAGAQVMQGHQKEAAQAKQAEQQKDPIIQNQQAELKIKTDEVALKGKTAEADARLKGAELERKIKKDKDDAMMKAKEIQLDERELEMKVGKEGIRMKETKRKDDDKMDLELARMVENRGNKEPKGDK